MYILGVILRKMIVFLMPLSFCDNNLVPKASNCISALEHNFDMWWSNLSLWSIFPPNNFTFFTLRFLFFR